MYLHWISIKAIIDCMSSTIMDSVLAPPLYILSSSCLSTLLLQTSGSSFFPSLLPRCTDNVCSPVLPDCQALSPNTFSILIQEQYSNARLKHICSKKILDLIKNTVSSFVGYSICLDETIHTGDSHVTMDYPREKISLTFCFACSKAITVSGTNSNKFIDFSETQMATGCL